MGHVIQYQVVDKLGNAISRPYFIKGHAEEAADKLAKNGQLGHVAKVSPDGTQTVELRGA